jgi:hypothetical protein
MQKNVKKSKKSQQTLTFWILGQNTTFQNPNKIKAFGDNVKKCTFFNIFESSGLLRQNVV